MKAESILTFHQNIDELFAERIFGIYLILAF